VYGEGPLTPPRLRVLAWHYRFSVWVKCATDCAAASSPAQAVLNDPFTKVCPMVQQCMQDDLQHLQDYYSGRPTSAEGGFRCQQRRLVLPACAAALTTTQPPPAAPAVDASQDSQGRDSGDGGPSAVSTQATVGSGQPCAGADISAPVTGLQPQGSTGGSLSRAPSGWLSRSGSGSSNARTGSGWRSYRRRLAPSCKELMYVCDGDRNGVVHYIATGEAAAPKGMYNAAATDLHDARHDPMCPLQPLTDTPSSQEGWQGTLLSCGG
jgi:hypothetical protein